MKALLNFKIGDMIAQLLAFFIPIAIGAYYNDFAYWGGVYFSLGGMQVLSCVLNLGFNPNWRSEKRGKYERALGLTLAASGLMVFFMLTTFVLFFLIVLVVGSLLMGFYYLMLTYEEYEMIQRNMERRKNVLTN